MKWLTNQKGFTMVELLIAMAVFSFMLSIVLVGFVSIVRIDQAGLTSRATQQNARDLSDTVTQSIRTSTQAWTSTVSSSVNTLCLGDIGGTTEYALFASANGSDLYSGPGPATASQPCNAPASPPSSWRKLNDDNVAVMLMQASVTPPIPGTLGTVSLTLGVASRNDLADTVLQPNPSDITKSQVACKPDAGDQFCAATTLTTSAALRGTN